jgi:glycogen debranching enzyme
MNGAEGDDKRCNGEGNGSAPRARAADKELAPSQEAEVVLPSAGNVDQLVRARGATFLVTDRNGDIAPAGARELGLFDHDTRYLSHYALHVGAGEVVRLSAETTHGGYNQVDLMLTDLERGDVLDDPKNFLHIRRRQLLDRGLVEQIVLTNFLRRRVSLACTVHFAADFVDIFEVRGARRARRGKAAPTRLEPTHVVLGYDGLDGCRYSTKIAFSVPPSELDDTHALLEVAIPAGEAVTLEIAVTFGRDPEDAQTALTDGSRGIERRSRVFKMRVERLTEDIERFREESTRFECDDARLRGLLHQGVSDLHDLRVQFATHRILGAGIPWFSSPFGRDALLTSYEALLVNPSLAEDSLRTLAAFQGTKSDERTEEEPGKIFHELRFGEMARTKEIPHSPYYGSVDATPLFAVLVEATYRVTGDLGFLAEMRAPLVAALRWIDARSQDGTRFVTYEKKSERGLDNQGWKDSRAGVSFPNGQRADSPIALCEVQGYCADAYRRGARALAALGEDEFARTYETRARALGELIERELWLEDVGRYAFAIDGKGRPLPTVVSNLGHLLWSRVPSRERARSIAHLLLAPPSFSGFGIRTLASDQQVYNPLSYHNGTVWPHDNALIARGFSHYDLGPETEKVFCALYEASSFFPNSRLPELFCGIPRRSGPLVRYPVACSPQAWAAAAPFLLVQSLLGLHADAPRGRLTIRNPRLPQSVRHLELHSMRIGNSLVSMRFRKVGRRCHVDRLDVSGAPLKTEIVID